MAVTPRRTSPAGGATKRVTLLLEGDEFASGGEEFEIVHMDATRPLRTMLLVARVRRERSDGGAPRWLPHRALAIVCTGRGTDGSLGAVAQNRAIASGRFRASPSNAPLESLGMESLDRAVRLAPMSTEDTPGPNNELSSAQLRTVRVALDVGYVRGATPDFVDTRGARSRRRCSTSRASAHLRRGDDQAR